MNPASLAHVADVVGALKTPESWRLWCPEHAQGVCQRSNSVLDAAAPGEPGQGPATS